MVDCPGLADSRLTAAYHSLLGGLGVEADTSPSQVQQDRFAHILEAYLVEGQAPVKSLEDTLARFKNWLAPIYRKALSLDVECTDEVRDTLNRLMSVEAEVSITAETIRIGELDGSHMEALELDAGERDRLADLQAAARAAAEAWLREQRNANRKEQLEAWNREAEEEASRERVAVTRKAIRTSGLDIEAVREQFGEETADRLARAIPGGLREPGKGVRSPEALAAEYGYDDVASMITELLEAPSEAERIAQIAQAKQAEHDARFSAEEALFATDAAAASLRYVSELLASRVNVMEQRKGGDEGKMQFRREEMHAVDEKTLRRLAQNHVRSFSLPKAVSAAHFRAYAKRALEASRRAMGEGDWGTALHQNELARLNMAMARLCAEKRVKNSGGRQDAQTGELEESAGLQENVDQAEKEAR